MVLCWSLQASCLEGLEEQVAALVISDRPAHDFAAVGIDDHTGLSPFVMCPMLRDVGEPNLIWATGSEPPLARVSVGRRVGAVASVAPMRDEVNSGSSHEAGQAPTPTPTTQVHSPFGMDRGRPLAPRNAW